MKKLAIATLTGALLLGLTEGDCTAFVTMLLLFTPIIFQKKGSVRNGKKRGAI